MCRLRPVRYEALAAVISELHLCFCLLIISTDPQMTYRFSNLCSVSISEKSVWNRSCREQDRRSGNHCCGKAISRPLLHILCVCVCVRERERERERECVCVCVALVTQYAVRMIRIILPSVPCLDVDYHTFPHYLIHGTIFVRRLMKIKCGVRLSQQVLSETFRIARRSGEILS
jgi:hypothetical protein